MMREKLFAGLAAVGIYLGVLALLLYYFGYQHRGTPQHFVLKNEKGITVTLAGAHPPAPPKPRSQSVRSTKRHAKPRNLTAKKPAPAKAPSKKPVKAPSKRPDAKKLFSRVKVKPKPAKKPESKSGQTASKKRGERSLKKRTKESGTENAYLARVEQQLRNWPAQANFAGQEVDVWLKIYPSGRFEYRILKHAGNPDFDRELVNYLRQLQKFGFGPHQFGRPYELEVKFVARG